MISAFKGVAFTTIQPLQSSYISFIVLCSSYLCLKEVKTSQYMHISWIKIVDLISNIKMFSYCRLGYSEDLNFMPSIPQTHPVWVSSMASRLCQNNSKLESPKWNHKFITFSWCPIINCNKSQIKVKQNKSKTTWKYNNIKVQKIKVLVIKK